MYNCKFSSDGRLRRISSGHGQGEPVVVKGASGRKKIHCLSGNVAGRTVIVIDDMIDTGETLRYATEVIKGARTNESNTCARMNGTARKLRIAHCTQCTGYSGVFSLFCKN